MKSSVKMIRIIAAIAVGIVITVGTNGAFAKAIIRHDGNVERRTRDSRQSMATSRPCGHSHSPRTDGKYRPRMDTR